MTAPGDEPALHVVADLRLDVDGVPAQVSGDGQRISVRTDHPWRLLAATAAPSRDSVGALVDRLAASGLIVELAGPRGPLGEAGAGVESRLGRLATGTSRVRFVVDRRTGFVLAAAVAGVAALGARAVLRR